MTFQRFVILNVLRNKRLYAAYFFSSLFSVLVFFTYAIFAFHPALSSDGMGDGVARGLHTAEGIIYVFSFFFILYSMSGFLKSRNKEFGLLVLHGMTGWQLRRMIFAENMLIGILSIGGGIGLGLLFSKALLLAGENLFQIEQGLSFYVPNQALLLTTIAFIALFTLISIFTMFMVRGKQIADLLKGGVKPRPEPKASRLLALLATLMLAGSYLVSLKARGMEVLFAFVPVTLTVIVATYFLFTQLSVYVINRMKKSEKLFWNKTNMIILADLSYRMKDNARTFFIVSIVSTVAFCAIGSLYSYMAIAKQSIDKGHPYAIDYTSYRNESNEQDSAAVKVRVEQELDRLGINYQGYDTQQSYWETEDDHTRIAIVPVSLYNQYAELLKLDLLELAEDESVMIVSAALIGYDKPKPIMLEGGIRLDPQRTVRTNPLRDTTESVYIVSDQQYATLGEPLYSKKFLMWIVPDHKEQLLAGERLSTFDPSSMNGVLFAKAYEMRKFVNEYYVLLFIGLFVGIVFFVASGSFLYLRLYSDLSEDQRNFRNLVKIGLSNKELTRVLGQQLAILFFTPVAVALVHGAVALKTLQNLFAVNLFWETTFVLGCFFAIQVVYYLLVRYYYVRNIRQSCGL